MKTIALGALAIAIAATSALAGDEVVNKDYKQPVPSSSCFRDQELQLDIFGTWMNESRGVNRNGGGGGVGVNYFFMRYVGFGIDGGFTSNRGSLADYTGKLILRFPIEMGGFCIAPYVFGGGGGQSELSNGGHNEGAYMTGGGLEWRATSRIGVFAEGRYTWTADTDRGDNAQARLGLRVAF